MCWLRNYRCRVSAIGEYYCYPLLAYAACSHSCRSDSNTIACWSSRNLHSNEHPAKGINHKSCFRISSIAAHIQLGWYHDSSYFMHWLSYSMVLEFDALILASCSSIYQCSLCWYYYYFLSARKHLVSFSLVGTHSASAPAHTRWIDNSGE